MEEFEIDNYVDRIDKTRETLNDHVASDVFLSEMSRFIPQAAFAKTLQRPEFVSVLLRTVDEHLAKARDAIKPPGPASNVKP